MVNGNELRKGNLIILPYEADKPIYPVLEIRENGIIFGKSYETGTGYCEFKVCGPIPLTPDWLKQCGYYMGYQTVFTKDHSGISVALELTKGLFQPVTIGGGDWIEFGKPLQYLHHLQNLYFDLTGEELNIPLI